MVEPDPLHRDAEPPAPTGPLPNSAAELLPIVYGELRRLAQDRMGRERRAHTLCATDLVHETFLRLVGDRQEGWASHAQFFSAAAEAMRRILIEHARSRGSQRRGGDYRSFPLDQLDLAVETRPAEVLAVDAAFEKLAGSDPRAADVVRMRFYAGLGEEETAAVLGLSVRTVRREWAYARTRLFEALRDEG